MPHNIEILSVGENSDAQILEVARILNGVQKEFIFSLPPERQRRAGAPLVESEYRTDILFDFLRQYRLEAKGHRPFLVAVVSGSLRSAKYRGIFGSHEAAEGLAIISLHDHQRYADSFRPFLCYYLIRYSLSFVCLR
jgi:hypothetical protein